MIYLNKKIIVFCISGLIAIWLGFLAFDQGTMLEYYKNSVYWVLSFNLFLFIISIIKIIINSYKNESLYKIIDFFKYNWIALIISIVIMTLGAFSCKADFRVLMDEANLLSDSQAIYEYKECFAILSSFKYRSGEKELIAGGIDKRPPFFPYLVSIIHSLTGYRPSNVFVFNFLVGFFSLFLIYYFISLMYGRFWGINGLLLLAAYPLFIVYCRSGGFDVFNMTCSLVFLICLYKFIQRPEAIRAEILLLWVSLFSQSRYESVLSVLIALAVIFYCLPKEEYKNFTYRLYVFPLLLVPPAWLRVMTNNAAIWQVDSFDECFSFNNFCNNIHKAVTFFISDNSDYGTIPIITILGIIGFVLFIYNTYLKNAVFNKVYLEKNFNNISSYKIFWVSVFLFYALISVVIFSYVWIDFTNPVISRQAILFVPLIVIMAISFLVRLSRYYNFNKAYFIVLGIFLLCFYWPYAVTANCGLNRDLLHTEFKVGRKMLEKYFPNKEEYIILYYLCNMYTPLGYNASIFKVQSNFEDVKKYYYDKHCLYFLVLQTIDSNSGLPYNCEEIPDNIESEVIYEVPTVDNFKLRISKCVPKSNN